MFSTVDIILHNSISQAEWKKENKYTAMSGGRGAAEQTHNNTAHTHVCTHTHTHTFMHTNTFLHLEGKQAAFNHRSLKTGLKSSVPTAGFSCVSFLLPVLATLHALHLFRVGGWESG